MRFGEAIVTKALYLIEDAMGKFFIMAALEHAVNQFGLEVVETTAFLPCGHGASELIRFASAKACGHHGQFNHLFLKNRNAQGAL